MVVFASTLFSRAVDPVVPKIAHDLGIDIKTAALLSTAFTLPYAFAQPVLGTIADFFGKTRLMNISLAVVGTATLICALANSFPLLVTMRVVAGMLAGGIFPVGIALVGDLVPVQDRQVAIARLLAVGLTGNLLGATISGVLGDLFGWRGVFLIIGSAGVVIAAIAFFAFRNIARPKPKPFNLTAVAAGFRSVFADPRAKFCFGAVFFEGIFIHGMFPYVALLLLATGVTRSSFAGLVIAGFGAGGIIYSFVVAYLVERFNQRKLMLAGGALAAIALALVALNFPWYELMAVFLLLGLGFYSLHGSIQLHVTELSPSSRGAAMSMHSCTFFLGQAIGPIYYGYAFSHAGTRIPPLIGAGVVLVIGMVCSRFLRHRRHPVTLADGT